MTKSLSNMIKAYSVRYKEDKKLVDVAEREEAILLRAAEAVEASGFVGGLHAIALEEQEGEPDGESLTTDREDAADAIPEENRISEEEAAVTAAEREEELKRIKCELTEAEKIALRIEMEKEIRTQADIILEQARAQAEQVKVKAKLAAEAEKLELFETAKKEGYEEGKLMLQQELSDLEASYAQKEKALSESYEQKVKELEPMVAETVIGLLESLTGVLLESKRGIVTYLISKALTESERSSSFLIKVSKDDVEEVRNAADSLRALFDREVVLEVVQDVLLKKGECMIETDSNIIDCSLGTQLEGLAEDIRLLSVQERA
ncbi:MAG: FliH/SctL family protein [Lachnospiraceae bacterium]|nr:FliH/SctL family protein [Lachnospiraceae bacterium]